MKVSVATPEKLVFRGEASSVSVVAEKGQLMLLERHADLVTLIKPGTLSVLSDGAEKVFTVSDGVLKVENNVVSVLTKSALVA